MLKIVSIVLQDLNKIRPKQAVKNVNAINFNALRDQGIKYIVFDKDQTLTLQDVFEFYNQEIIKTVQKAQTAFEKQNIVFLSNSS